jgi:hypothetical protein
MRRTAALFATALAGTALAGVALAGCGEPNWATRCTTTGKVVE